MKNKKGRIILLTVVLLIVALCFSISYGKAMKTRYVNDIDFNRYLQTKGLKVVYSHYPFDKKYDVYGEGNTVTNYSDLEKKSALIIKAKLTEGSTREIYQECILSKIEILNVYKGDVSKGAEVNLFEPVNCTGIKGQLLLSEGYVPMQQGQEYILFLTPLKNSRFGSGDYVYIPSTLTYSKYNFNNNSVKFFKDVRIEQGEAVYEYVKIMNENIYCSDKNVFNRYSKIKAVTMKAYN